MRSLLQKAARFLSSLRLTVVLLGLGMVLIFLATLDQVNLGIYIVLERYFRSWVAMIGIPFSNPKFVLPLPGGTLLGTLLLTNLIFAHASRFHWKWEKGGILFIHLGVIFLLVGELLTGMFAREAQMRLDEGATKSYSEAPREVELAITEGTTVTAIPQDRLKTGATFSLDALPIDITVRKFVANSSFEGIPEGADPTTLVLADQGIAQETVVAPKPRETAMDKRDLPSAYLELADRTSGDPLGTWLVSNAVAAPQPVTVGDRTLEIALRQRREYKPFSITLLEFTHERYPGTSIPKNFSSNIRLRNPETGEDREVLIYMNHPLRYGGYTFYQQGFDNDDTTSILQVVQNPVWLLPYISCGMVSLGLLWVFLLHLGRFLNRRKKMAKSTAPSAPAAPASPAAAPAAPAPAAATTHASPASP
ncbi:hypothetical protein BH23VER1_BH23VER1_30180 [soil metagenome]